MDSENKSFETKEGAKFIAIIMCTYRFVKKNGNRKQYNILLLQ